MKTTFNHKSILHFCISAGILSLLISLPKQAKSQVGIGTTTPNASAILDMVSTSKGLLVSRMTNAQRSAMNPLPAAAQGLMVYQTDAGGDGEGFYYNTSTTTTPTWIKLVADGGSGWTDDGTAVRLTTSTDNVGIGTATPGVRLAIQASAANTNVVDVLASGGTNRVFRVINNSATGDAILDLGKNSESGTYDPDAVRLNANGNSYFMGGNVGIGTTSPTAKLYVNGNNSVNPTTRLELQQNSSLTIKPHSTNSTNMNIGQVNNGSGMGIQVTNSGATANWDIALNPFGGNVGIGITNPSRLLDVNGHMALGGYAYNTVGGDVDSYFGFAADNNFTMSIGGWEDLTMTNLGVVFNEDGQDVDFRVESDLNANMFVVDGENQGRIGFGITASSFSKYIFGGDMTSFWTGGTLNGMEVAPSVKPAASSSANMVQIAGTIVEGSAGAHTLFAGLYVDAPSITAGTSTLANAASVYIAGAPSATVTGGNYALYSAGGTNYFAGNVGIGTTTPVYPLHVTLPDNGSLNGIRFEGLRSVLGSHAVRLELTAPNSPAAVNKKNFQIINITPSSAGGQNILNFRSVTDAGATASDLMSLTHDGNVGIGTTSPLAKLNVYANGIDAVKIGKANAGNVLLTEGQSAGVNDLIVNRQTSGTWGSAGKTMLKFQNIESASTAWNFIQAYNDPNESGDYDNLVFELDGTGAGYFAGNVGIGTTSPFGNLSVTGLSGAPNDQGIFQVTDGTGANTDTKIVMGVVASDYGWIQATKPGTNLFDLALNPNGGNVGIGTTNPVYKLDVNGTFRASGDVFAEGGQIYGGRATGGITNAGYTTVKQLNGSYQSGLIILHVYASGNSASTRCQIYGFNADYYERTVSLISDVPGVTTPVAVSVRVVRSDNSTTSDGGGPYFVQCQAGDAATVVVVCQIINTGI
ncbi:hypothetical protein JYU20_00820 [Bacteroidales bacterium AH-315-I05]|nr:hypothetical protein [Bacteroidales bacterium AH-315-I05]